MMIFAALHESAFGTKRTWASALHISAFGGKVDVTPLHSLSQCWSEPLLCFLLYEARQ